MASRDWNFNDNNNNEESPDYNNSTDQTGNNFNCCDQGLNNNNNNNNYDDDDVDDDGSNRTMCDTCERKPVGKDSNSFQTNKLEDRYRSDTYSEFDERKSEINRQYEKDSQRNNVDGGYDNLSREKYTYDYTQSFTEYMSQSFKEDDVKESKSCPYRCLESNCDPSTLTNCYCCSRTCSSKDFCYGGFGSCSQEKWNSSTEDASGGKETGFCKCCEDASSTPREQYEVTAKVLFGSANAISMLKQTNKQKKSSKK